MVSAFYETCVNDPGLNLTWILTGSAVHGGVGAGPHSVGTRIYFYSFFYGSLHLFSLGLFISVPRQL